MPSNSARDGNGTSIIQSLEKMMLYCSESLSFLHRNYVAVQEMSLEMVIEHCCCHLHGVLPMILIFMVRIHSLLLVNSFLIKKKKGFYHTEDNRIQQRNLPSHFSAREEIRVKSLPLVQAVSLSRLLKEKSCG